MAEPGDLRASDEDRDRAATELREHYAAGRLSESEFDERVAQAYDAATAGELTVLRADLPNLPAAPGEQRAAHLERRAQLRRRLLQTSGGAVGVVVLCCVIWAVSGAGYFWPMWVALGVLMPLARNGWMLYGPGADLDRAERQLERAERGHHHHGHRRHRRR